MDYEKAASFWTAKRTTAPMDESELRGAIDAFVGKHHVCALATGSDGFIRNTPIEYNYTGGKFWILSEGGLKFRGLKDNKNVCLAIFEENSDFGSLHGMQIYGIAQVVEPFTDDYNKLIEYKKIPAESLKRLKEPINLIKINPKEIDFINADFRKNGFDARQHLSIKN